MQEPGGRSRIPSVSNKQSDDRNPPQALKMKEEPEPFPLIHECEEERRPQRIARGILDAVRHFLQ
jgi:hypothetical protein